MSLTEKIQSNPRLGTRYVDKTFWVLFAALIFVALVALYSASSTLIYHSSTTFGPVAKQLFFIVIGAIAAWFIQYLPTWVIRMGGYALLALMVVFLYLMLIPGMPGAKSINGATRWFSIAGFQFQPSEFAKISLMVVIADQLARIKEEEDNWRYFRNTLVIAGVTIFPIMVGNLSTAVLMAGIVFFLWVLAQVKWKYILTTIGIVLGIAIAGYCIVEFAFVRPGVEVHGIFKRATTWVSRIDHMLEEHHDAQDGKTLTLNDENYQRSLAKVAVARGWPLGVGPGNSVERDYLPLAYADYIFAIIVEESGLWGAFGLICIYLIILFRACLVCSRFGDATAMLMVMGVALMLVCQALISMGVAVGIGPVTGQPLPMITTGGSSYLATSLYFAIMMAVSREQNQLKGELEQVKEDSQNETINLDEIDTAQTEKEEPIDLD